jgi:MYXO-CTERM domain-containing protein
MRILAPVTVLGLLGLPGCAEQPPSLGTTAGMSFEEYRAAASAHREPGTGAYIVDGDIVLHGDDALYRYWSRTQQGALTIYAVNGVDVTWDNAQKLNLSYCVSDTFGAMKQAVVTAMAQAADNGWAKFANVRFVYVPAQDATCTAFNPNVLFDVRPIDSNDQYLARAFFPDDTRGNRNVLIDADSYNTIWPLANILAHELGHALGFRHEHVRAPGAPCPEGEDYRAITAYDAASVMHYPQCGGTSQTLAFTTLDQEGSALVYGNPAPPNPLPMAAINAPKNNDVVAPTFTVNTSIIDTDLAKAELFIDGALYQTLTAAPFTFQVTNLAPGYHDLLVKATDMANQTASQTIRIGVLKPDDGGSGSDGGFDRRDEGGGCNTGGAPTGAALLAALGLVGARRRRRRR